jgi:curved DNA-binding protein CbpA
MSPFERLGIAATADEREIKRAYARELRRSRPDEDPAGFQDLHDAYQHCLAYAEHRRALGEDDDGPAEIAPEHRSEYHSEHDDGPVEAPPADRVPASEPSSERPGASADDRWRRPPPSSGEDEDRCTRST